MPTEKKEPRLTYRHRGPKGCFCQCCQSQIADIYTRLEKLEREALTKEKLLKDSSGSVAAAHISYALTKHGFTERLEVGSYSGAGVVPPELEVVGRENSAALEEMMKRIDG